MAEEKKAVNKGIVYEPTCVGSYNNKVDVIYGFRVKSGTVKEEGVGQEICIPGYDTANGFDGFEAWCKKNYDCTPQVYLARAQKNIGTIARYDKALSITENQALADAVTLVPRKSGGSAMKTKAAKMDKITAAAAGVLSDDEIQALIAKAAAKKAKK